MSTLFEPATFRGVTLKNRIVVSPMCQYSCIDGFANEWHLVHLGARAVGGAALVMTEAAAVSLEGRISPSDLGIYRDEHVEKLAEIAAFVSANGAVAGIQLAHAGRKASTAIPWEGSGEVATAAGGWQTVAPSAIAFDAEFPLPRALSLDEIAGVRRDFVAAAKRSIRAGFRVVELHAAHGYLIHQFLSPLANRASTRTAGRSRIARVSRSRSRPTYGPRYPRTCRSSFASRRPIG